MIPILKDREKQIFRKGSQPFDFSCDTHSLAGSVSQRACVFCGSRVVLYPIADALHLIHGPIGCAAYTWDIRGALSSGPQLHRMSFSTDLQENEVIFGGEPKLYRALTELIDTYKPKAAFVYSTCIVGIIGDDVAAVCKKVAREQEIPVMAVHSTRSSSDSGNKRPFGVAPTACPERPTRCTNAEMERGEPSWQTRSTSPISIPSSSEAVATSALSFPDFNLCSARSRCLRDRLP